MNTLTILGLVFVTWYLYPKEEGDISRKQLGLSVLLILGWVGFTKAMSAFWLGPFLGINLGTAETVYESEMQETGFILIGSLWVLFGTILFPIVLSGKHIWSKLRKSAS